MKQFVFIQNKHIRIKILSSLERDCADLNQEMSTLECLLENVDLWWAYLGQWQAQVLFDEIGNGQSCIAALIRGPNSEQDQVGWVITRTLYACQHFSFRLKEVCFKLICSKK
jgi:hypothetical protein